MDGCALEAPLHLGAGVPRQPPRGGPPPKPIESIEFASGSRIFSPTTSASDGWYSTIWASQHPARCEDARFLLVEDDLQSQGLGFSSEWLILALLYALRERRVLLEVPVDPSWNPTCVPPFERPVGRPSGWGWTVRKKLEEARRKRDGGAPAPPPPPPAKALVCSLPTPGRPACEPPPCTRANNSRSFHYTGVQPSTRPRWCTRAPFTHECFYESWSHCAAPPRDEHVAPRLGKGNDVRQNIAHDNATRVMRIKLSWLVHGHRWFGDRKVVEAAAARFLFRPRPWVRRLAGCVLRRAGAAPAAAEAGHRPAGQKYLSVHIRDSVEKNRELRFWGHSRLPLGSYGQVAKAASGAFGHTLIHVQTASGPALRAFNQSVAAAGLRIFHTPRLSPIQHTERDTSTSTEVSHDTWGGWQAGMEMGSAIEAAVNIQIAIGASALISPTYSAWTTMLMQLMGGRENRPVARRRFCCSCAARDHGGNMDLVAVERGGDTSATTTSALPFQQIARSALELNYSHGHAGRNANGVQMMDACRNFHAPK